MWWLVYNAITKILTVNYSKGKILIGDITSAQAWWNNDGVWVNKRKYWSN